MLLSVPHFSGKQKDSIIINKLLELAQFPSWDREGEGEVEADLRACQREVFLQPATSGGGSQL